MAEPEVIVYSTSTCQYCGMARDYLREKGVKFTDYDVSKDKARMEEMVALTSQTAVPVLVINGRIQVGFNRELVDIALSRPAPPKREDLFHNLFFDHLNI